MDEIITRTEQTEHGTYVYDYDTLYRLTDVDNPTLNDEAYSYDAVGNRLSASGVSGAIMHNANNELEYDGDISYDYDANGNMVSKTSAAATRQYIYNVQNRLVRIEDGSGGVIAEYYYDPFGRRLWKEADVTRTYFFYADEGLVAEYDENGEELHSYGYTPNSIWTTNPLWMKESASYYWYQNDHLGTPQKLIDSNGTVVWSATYSAFGEAHIGIETVTNNLHFPGQYFDTETGLHYNWFRFYDPGTGRYVRSDPVGVNGGMNTYGYVGGNPVVWFDSKGLNIEILIGGPYEGHLYGHAALRVYGDGYEKVYEYGRYRETWGIGGSKGEGMFRIWNNFRCYIRAQNLTGGRTTYGYVYETSREQDERMMEHYETLIKDIDPNLSRTDKTCGENYMQQYQISDYHAANYYCTTVVLDGLALGLPLELFTAINNEEFEEGRGLTFLQRQTYAFAKEGEGLRMPLDVQQAIEAQRGFIIENTYCAKEECQ